MIKRPLLFLDNLINRDKYLAGLNKRIDYFTDRYSSITKRVIDDVEESDIGEEFHVPEVAASDLTLECLKSSIQEQGCLIVRDFFSANEVNDLKAYIDHSFSIHGNDDTAINKYLAKQIDLEQVLKNMKADIEEKQKTNPTYTDTVKIGKNLSQPLGGNKSHLTAQTPILTEKLLNLFEQKNLKSMLTNYFGNEPCVSVYKWVVRRSGPPENPIDFHQDGTFMGDEISSLNSWIPISNCGTGYDRHGMDLVPIRFKRAFEKGTGFMNWTISQDAVISKLGEKAIVTPTFRKGDILFFDHFLVHRSQSMPGPVEHRYAIETWFFDSLNFPKNQIPIKW